MKILVTGAKGFVGKNLCASLYNIKNKKDRRFPELNIENVFEYDIDTDSSLLDIYCSQCDFIFNLAGVNRPQDPKEFMAGNFEFTSTLLDTLKKNNNKAPIMISSSIQALVDNPYGRSKKAGENLLIDYAEKNNVKVLIYRFPNLFGKWCRPNYNSVIATFCNNIANDLPIQVNNRDTLLTLVYIDDLVDEMINALRGIENSKGYYCKVKTEYQVTLGHIVDTLYTFKEQPKSLIIPKITENSFEKKLYSTFLSYLPKDKVVIPLKMNVDDRGSFTELLKTVDHGQFSVNISKPGITKGEHWHNTKWEFFIVVSGHGLIQMRKVGTDEVLKFEVNGEKIEAIHMLPGYTHNIINLSKTENLVTLMWSNELFDPNKPDTFLEKVEFEK